MCLAELISKLISACLVAVLTLLVSGSALATSLHAVALVFATEHLPDISTMANDFLRPVLKHGPRSLTYVQVHGC